MRIIKNLLEHKVAVLLIIALLCVQATCDLALPNYTSDIVDVGIQQQGVEDVAATQLSERTHDLVAMMLPESDEQTFADAYAQNADGTYDLTDVGRENRAALNSSMALPLTVVHYADQIPDLDLDQAKAAYDAGMVSKDDMKDVNTFDLAVPVGMSYEFDRFVVDARYNIGVTKVPKHGDGYTNVLQLTIGYKFNL